MSYIELNKAIDTLDATGKQLYFAYPGREKYSEAECLQLIEQIRTGKIKEAAPMKSVENVLQESISKMNTKQSAVFADKVKQLRKVQRHVPIELQINVAKKVLGLSESEIRESYVGGARSRPFEGKRNNGSSTYVDATPHTSMQEADATLYKHLGMNTEQIEKTVTGLPKQIREASEQVQADYRFLRAINLTESQAIAGALNNTLRKK